MARIYPDPDKGFNGVYAGGSRTFPENQHDLAALADYLRTTGRKFSDLSESEIERFAYHDQLTVAQDA